MTLKNNCHQFVGASNCYRESMWYRLKY